MELHRGAEKELAQITSFFGLFIWRYPSPAVQSVLRQGICGFSL